MIYSFTSKVFAGDAMDWCAPVRLGACGALVALDDVAAIVCTARNLGTNGIVNSRLTQNVLNLNGGVYADGEFTIFLSATDTALVGSALTTDRETHVFSFTITLDNGTIGTFELCVECLPRPAAALNKAADIGRIHQEFRILIGELDPACPDNDWIDGALQDGCKATNGVLKYHDGDSSITLVAGTAEYDLPVDVVDVLWGEWSDKELFIADQDQQRRRGRWWRTQPQGPPEKYVLWGRKLIVIPTPDAATVAVDPTLLLRGCTTPAPFRLNGFVQLGSQYYDIPQLYAASKWWGSPQGRDGGLAKSNFEMWQQRLAMAKKDYDERLVI